MNSLENICLSHISCNLYLNYLILCENKQWKIPESVRDSIFYFYFENVEKLEEKNFHLFFTPQLSISSLTINRKYQNFQMFFEKINKEEIRKVNVYLNDESCLDCLRKLFKTKVENLEIFNIQFIDFSFDSLTLEVMEKNDMAMDLLFENLGENLKELKIKTIKNSEIPIETLLVIFKLLERNKKLTVFKFQNFYCNEDSKALKEVYSIHKNLQEMSIDIHWKSTIEEMREFFEKFPNLTRLSIDCSHVEVINGSLLSIMKLLEPLNKSLKMLTIKEYSSYFSSEVLDLILKNFKKLQDLCLGEPFGNIKFEFNPLFSKGFSRLAFYQEEIESNYLEMIVKLLEKSETVLDEIIIVSKYLVIDFDEDLISLMKNTSKVAKITQISVDICLHNFMDGWQKSNERCGNVKIYLKNDSDKTLSCLTDLKNMSFGFELENCGVGYWRGIESILSFQTINYSNNSKGEGIENYEMFDFRQLLSTFNHLRIISFYKTALHDNFEKICKGLLNSKKTLEEIEFTDCHLKNENRKCLKDLLKECDNLKTLRFDQIPNDFLDENILNEIGRKSLETLVIDCKQNLIPNVIKILKQLHKLKFFRLQCRDLNFGYETKEIISNILCNCFSEFVTNRGVWISFK